MAHGKCEKLQSSWFIRRVKMTQVGGAPATASWKVHLASVTNCQVAEAPGCHTFAVSKLTVRVPGSYVLLLFPCRRQRHQNDEARGVNLQLGRRCSGNALLSSIAFTWTPPTPLSSKSLKKVLHLSWSFPVTMGAGHSRNLCEAAAANEVERARHFIKEDKDAINKADKVRHCTSASG